jgi:hypothetical protein
VFTARYGLDLYIRKGKGHPMTGLCWHKGSGGGTVPTKSQSGNRKRWVVGTTLLPLYPVKDPVSIAQDG